MAAYIDIIKQFINGKIDLKQLSDYIDERLFDLRQDPDSMTEEQQILSQIELLLCEIKDGFRSIEEVYEYAAILVINPSANKTINLSSPEQSCEFIKIGTSSERINLEMKDPGSVVTLHWSPVLS